jgi:glycosyltransferase involved in cell wall biosynthesis
MQMATRPTISVVTPSFNQSQYLEEAILSVLSQRYPGLQYIVIDGGSRDGSVDILQRHADSLSYWESEPDRGQVHALNKGLARSTGELFCFINSDDLLLPGALHAAADAFERTPGLEWLCGDTLFFGEGHATRLHPTVVPRSARHLLTWSYSAPQPGMFWRRDILDGGFDERWPYGFDHEMYLRLLLKGCRCVHLPVPIAAYRLHATSKTVAENEKQNAEFDLIAAHYEPRLAAGDRRASAATRHLRRSFAASTDGDWRGGARCLLAAGATQPGSIFSRAFWGCFRRLLTSAWTS